MVIGFDGSRVFVSDRTGTENYSYQLLKALSEIDTKNKYIVYIRPSPSSDGGDEGDSSEVGRKEGWPQNFIFKEINWSRLWTQMGLALQTFQDQLDVLFVPAHTLPLIRRLGLKTVVTVHDLGSEYLPSMHQLKQRLYLSLMQRFQLQTASKIITVSKATKEDLINRIGIKPEKIRVAYEGFDQKLFKPVKGDLLINSLRQYGLKPQEYFLFVGTVQPRKNLEKLILAFSYWLLAIGKNGERRTANGEQLVIAGSKGWMSNEIYQLPNQLGIEDKVKFLGYVPEKDLPALYSGATIFTFPSLFEGFGLPILEAQACGCPVLTSKVSSMPEIGGEGAVYVNPVDVDDIVRGITRIMNHELRIKLVKQGFQNIKRFSWQKCAKETLKVLQSV